MMPPGGVQCIVHLTSRLVNKPPFSWILIIAILPKLRPSGQLCHVSRYKRRDFQVKSARFRREVLRMRLLISAITGRVQMGGPGSGSWYRLSKKDVVEECREIDARRWQKESFFGTSPRHVSWEWYRDGEQ